MAFYCSISFYFCMGSLYYFAQYLHWFNSKTVPGPFHSIRALFLCLGGVGVAFFFENIPPVRNHWHYLTSWKYVTKTNKSIQGSMKRQEDWLFLSCRDCLLLSLESQSQGAAARRLAMHSSFVHMGIAAGRRAVLAQGQLWYLFCSARCVPVRSKPGSSRAPEEGAFRWLCFQPSNAVLLQTYEPYCCWRRRPGPPARS